MREIMAPHAEDFEEVERLNGDYQIEPVHQGRRILPEEPPPVRAWIESEEAPGGDSRTNSPGENRRLLGNKQIEKPNSKLQAGLGLVTWVPPKKQTKCPALNKKGQVKTKFQKRKEKVFEALRPPYFIISMIMINVTLHLCGPEEWRKYLEWSPGAWWREPWRLFTYGLVHAGAAHLALNDLVALAVGWRLEHEQGWVRVALVWCGGVVAGALGAGALQPHVRVVGASAAVYALLTAHLPNVCLRFGHIPLWWFRPLSVLVLGASEGCWSLMRHPDSNLSNEHVAWAAHVLGAAVGIPLAFFVFTGENRNKSYIVLSRTTSGALLIAGVLMAVLQQFMSWHKVDNFT